MITRLYVDNVGPLVNFEWRPGRLNLLLGENGSGKTCLLEVVNSFRLLMVREWDFERSPPPNSVTCWSGQTVQTWELDADIDGVIYQYVVVFDNETVNARQRRWVLKERLSADGAPLIQMQDGKLTIFPEVGGMPTTLPAIVTRSGVGMIPNSKEYQRLSVFKAWLRDKLHSFSLIPRMMSDMVTNLRLYPEYDLSDFASWYAHWLPRNLGPAMRAQKAIAEIIPAFESLQVSPNGGKLQATFHTHKGTPAHTIDFGDLSDGQRQLCALYALRHAYIQPGHTFLIDEPTNFVSLREIQPWLNEVIDATDAPNGPQVFIVSHHPEIINQLAPQHGVRFFRDGGPTRIAPFKGAPGLTASETIARGWGDE
jgi:ABC-type transport system involved in cytochrome c biogenesis ATPase subunit